MLIFQWGGVGKQTQISSPATPLEEVYDGKGNTSIRGKVGFLKVKSPPPPPQSVSNGMVMTIVGSTFALVHSKPWTRGFFLRLGEGPMGEVGADPFPS